VHGAATGCQGAGMPDECQLQSLVSGLCVVRGAWEVGGGDGMGIAESDRSVTVRNADFTAAVTYF
jgi:hypothetical protein